MINKLSVFLIKFLVDNSDTSEDIEIYHFAIFVIISNMIYSIVSIVVGLIFSCTLEMIVFLLSFKVLRHFAGGYHSKSELCCDITSMMIICLIGLLIMLSKKYIIILRFSIAISILSFLIILCLSPIEAEAKPLSSEERKRYRIISIAIDIVIIFIIIIAYFYKLNLIYTPCCFSLLFESILLITGKVKEVSSDAK